jgi:peroxiredoxin
MALTAVHSNSYMKEVFPMARGPAQSNTLKVGDKAPDFMLPATGERTIHLANYLGKKNVFIAFYPLDWTPV